MQALFSQSSKVNLKVGSIRQLCQRSVRRLRWKKPRFQLDSTLENVGNTNSPASLSRGELGFVGTT